MKIFAHIARLAARFSRAGGVSLFLFLWLTSSVHADNVGGAWLSPVANNWPLIAIHATLLPDGRVLSYGTDGIGRQTGFLIYDVWDPSAGLSGGHLTLDNMTLTDIFCSSQVVLPQSGGVFIAGGDNWTGSSTTNVGNNNSNVYANGSLTRGSNMNSPRWYSSSTVLANGEIYIQGGYGGFQNPEVRQLNGSFRFLSSADTGGLAQVYPRNFLAPDGRVFGYDIVGEMYWVDTSGTGDVSRLGQFSSAYGGFQSGSAMFRPGKILTLGGNSNKAQVIDITGGAPVVTPTQSMSSQRQWVSATVLADGRVLATGGSAVDNELNDVNTSAEIWDPATGLWTVGASGLRPRLYHSTALLLPDASVLVAGGGAPGPVGAVDINLHAEIYYPPYLYNAAGGFASRPSIITAPDTLAINQPFAIDVGSANIQRVTLVKTGSVTHSVNMDQRFLELSYTASGGILTVQAPANATAAPPGYYLLFVINNVGVPSVGKIVRMNIPGGDSTPPSITISTPTTATTFSSTTSPITVGGTASDGVGVTQVTWTNSLGGSGTASGTTSWSVSGIALQSGANVITVTARDAAGNTGTDSITVTYTPAPDTTPPVATITGPTSAATYATSATPLSVSGTASDGVGVTQVTWANSLGGSGTASGTTSWSVSGIALQSGANVITVTARDAAGNTGTDSITVTYTPGTDTTPPVATITGPTSAATYATSATPMSVSGTASDGVGVTQVTWANSLGGSGTASGTTSWSISGIALQSGTNVITVTARDAAGNTGTDALSVSYTPTSPAGGLVAAYSFDDAVGALLTDSSGNANAGALTNGPVWTTGKNGGALQFDGVNDRVRVNDSDVLDLSVASTFEAWVYPTASLSGWRTILQKEVDAYLLTASSGTNTPASGGTFNGYCCTSASTPAALPVNAWTHVAATYDGAQIRMYVNGTQVSTVGVSGTYERNANPLWIGGNAVYGEHFQGKLDDMRIYNRALSSAEIMADMNAPVGASPNLPPALTNPGNQSGIAGVPVTLPITASDPDRDALSYSATGLPSGLAINGSTGVISGTPTTPGTTSVTITVFDGKASTTANLSWIINAQDPLVLDPMPRMAPQLVNASITYTVSARNGVNTQIKWYFGDGSESPWSASSTVTHTFAKPGIYWLSVTAKDDRGITQSQTSSQLVYLPLTVRQPASSRSVTIGNGRLWVVNQDNDSVSVFDLSSNQKLAEINVGAGPRTLALSPGGEVWVTNRHGASISVIDATTMTVGRTIALPYASQPFGLIFAPDGASAYVALEAVGRVLRLDPSSGSELGSAYVGPKPRHLSVSADSARLYVSRFITPRLPGEDSAVVTTAVNNVQFGGEVVVLDTGTLGTVNTVVLRHSDDMDFENQGSGIPNYLGPTVISPDGTAAWIPSKKDNVKRGTLRSGGNLNHQNTVRAISSRIDLGTGLETFGARVDHDNSSLASAAAFDRYGVYLFVALETSREVAVVDANDYTELFRISAGRAPQGLAVSADGYTLYVSNFMDRTVSVYDLTKLVDEGQWQAPLVATLQSVATEKLSPTVLMGKQFFYDARDTRVAREGYMSCASCHNDGGYDGRTWDLTGHGEGLRNTIALNGRAGAQGFLHWSSNFDEVQDFEGQIRSLAGGTGLMPDLAFNQGTRSQPLGDPKSGVSVELDALAAYVASLNQFAKSPFRNTDGTLTADGVAGKTVFEAQNCAQCHGGANFSDSGNVVLHDIGTIKQPASGKRLGGALTGIDSPTLRDVWSTAPYLHDGSAATLDDAVRAHSGVSIANADLAQLVAYLKQIDGDEPAPAPPANSAPVVTNPGAQIWTVGSTVSLQIVATDANSTDTLSYSASGLPLGLTINGTTGVISGVPSAAGTGSSTVTVNDGKAGIGTATFAWTVNAANVAPVVTNPGGQNWTAGTAASLQIVATDANPSDSLSYSASGLPAGLTINGTTGVINGVPSAAGTGSSTVTVNDGRTGIGTATFAWTVNAANVAPVVTNPGAQTWTAGTAATLQIAATDADPTDTLSYSASGLPAGLTINGATGLISGVPTTAGSGSSTVTVNDGRTGIGTATFAWTVNAPDTQAPSRPSVTTTKVNGNPTLTWTASTDNVGVKEYVIYRSTTGVLGSEIARTAATTWTDTGVQEAIRYTYGVKAIDAAGNQSAASTLKSVTAGAVPTTPSGLKVVLVNHQPQLTWNASTDNVAVVGYIVYRSTNGTLGPEVVRTPSTSWLDTSVLVVGTKYTYAVKAYDAAGYLSGRSSLVGITVK